MILVKPGYDYLQSYALAIQRGWLPDHHRADSGEEVLRLMRASPDGFFARFDDPNALAALAQLLPHARSLGLPFVELTTDAGNEASQRVIYANGGVLTERFHKLSQHGGGPALRFRIPL